MIKGLLRLTKNHHMTLVASFCFSLLGTIGQTALIYGIFALFTGWRVTLCIIFGFIGITLLLGLSRYLEQYLGHLVAFKLLAELRNRVYQQLRLLAPAKLDTAKSGDILSLINNDIEMVEVFFAHTIVPVALAIGYACVMTTVFSYQIGWKALYVLFCYLLIGTLLPFYKQKTLLEVNHFLTGQKGKIKQQMLEIIRGRQELKQFQVLGTFLTKLTASFEKEQTYTKQNEQIASEKTFYIQILLVAMTLGLLWLTKSEIAKNQALLRYGLLFYFTFDPFLALSNLSISLNKAFQSAKRLLDFLEESPQVIDSGTKTLDGIKNVASQKLSFHYPEQPELILDDVSLTIAAGETIGIKGTSGTGKSTFVKVLMKWYPYQSGQISLNNLSLETLRNAAVRNKINYLSQNPVIFDGTLRENLTLRQYITDDEIFRLLKAVQLEDKVKRNKQGLDTKLSAKASPFSSGELQRIELVRSLLHPSSLLILDEPTSNLDAQNEQIILDTIEQHYQGIVVIISHRDSSFKHCHRVLELRDKQFVEIKI